MEMDFGNALDIWRRVVCGDNTLTNDEVKAAARWFDDFSSKLSDKATQSEQELETARLHRMQEIERKSKGFESDKRQLDNFIRKYDDLINWLNTHL